MADARRLAESLVAIGTHAGVRTEALITAMDDPLGRAVGNALEVIESIETLKGNGPKDLEDLSVRLAARMVMLAGLADSDKAERMVREAIGSGAGVEKFRQIIAWQGGDPAVVDDYRRLPQAAQRHAVRADRAGYVAVDRRDAGGARGDGARRRSRSRRRRRSTRRSASSCAVARGDEVEVGNPLAELHYNDRRKLFEAIRLVNEALTLADEPPAAPRASCSTKCGKSSDEGAVTRTRARDGGRRRAAVLREPGASRSEHSCR